MSIMALYSNVNRFNVKRIMICSRKKDYLKNRHYDFTIHSEVINEVLVSTLVLG